MVSLFLDRLDPASVVLDFLGSRRALCGIGATARGVRAAVKGSLPGLGLKFRTSCIYHPRSVLQPKGYTRLRHLKLRETYGALGFDVVNLVVGAGLNQRLESLRLDATCFTLEQRNYHERYEQHQMGALVTADWPRLRLLDLGRLGALLDALEKLPPAATPLPSLRSLGVKELEPGDARRLLVLMDRGVLATLRALTASTMAPSHMKEPERNRDGGGDYATDLCALLARLPETDVLSVDKWDRGTDSMWKHLGELITNGGLANLT